MLGGAYASSIDVEGSGCSCVGSVVPGLFVLCTVVHTGRQDSQDDTDDQDKKECFRVERKCFFKLFSYFVRFFLFQQLVHIVGEKIVIFLTHHGLSARVSGAAHDEFWYSNTVWLYFSLSDWGESTYSEGRW